SARGPHFPDAICQTRTPPPRSRCQRRAGALLRPFSRTHMDAVADAMNLCARLNAVAGAGETLVSNLLPPATPRVERAACTELEPVEAKNIGRVKAWRLAG